MDTVSAILETACVAPDVRRISEAERAEFPPLAELWTLLERTHKRLLDVLDAASPAELDRPPRVANPYFHTLGQGIYQAALHENYHVGQIAPRPPQSPGQAPDRLGLAQGAGGPAEPHRDVSWITRGDHEREEAPWG